MYKHPQSFLTPVPQILMNQITKECDDEHKEYTRQRVPLSERIYTPGIWAEAFGETKRATGAEVPEETNPDSSMAFSLNGLKESVSTFQRQFKSEIQRQGQGFLHFLQTGPTQRKPEGFRSPGSARPEFRLPKGAHL